MKGILTPVKGNLLIIDSVSPKPCMSHAHTHTHMHTHTHTRTNRECPKGHSFSQLYVYGGLFRGSCSPRKGQREASSAINTGICTNGPDARANTQTHTLRHTHTQCQLTQLQQLSHGSHHCVIPLNRMPLCC